MQPPAPKNFRHLCMTIKNESYVSDFGMVENYACNEWKVIQAPCLKFRFFVVVEISQKWHEHLELDE